MHAMLVVAHNTSLLAILSKLHLCKLSGGDGPHFSGRSSRSPDSARHYIHSGADACSCLVVVSNLGRSDFDDCHPRVLGTTIMDTVAHVAKPSSDDGIVELGYEAFLLFAPVDPSLGSEGYCRPTTDDRCNSRCLASNRYPSVTPTHPIDGDIDMRAVPDISL